MLLFSIGRASNYKFHRSVQLHQDQAAEVVYRGFCVSCCACGWFGSICFCLLLTVVNILLTLIIEGIPKLISKCP